MEDLQERLSEGETAERAAARQRLLVVSPPVNGAPKERAVNSLAAVFGRLAEMQNMVGDQVIALEDLVQQQVRQLSEVATQLPDMKERINWLIASYYEDDLKSQDLRERLARQEAGMAALTDVVRGLWETQSQWRQTIEQLLLVLGRAQSAPVPAPPRWPE